MLRAEVGRRVKFVIKASAEWFMRGRGIDKNPGKTYKMQVPLAAHRAVAHRWRGVGRWRMRSPVKAFPRNLRSGLPLRRIGEVETADSLQTKTSWCLMVDGKLESVWSQLHYTTRTLSPVRLVLKVTLYFLFLFFALVWYNRKKGNTPNSVIPREKLCC